MNYFSDCSSTPEPLKETLGERLSRTLRHRKISHTEMAEHLGLHRNTIGSYCTGKVSPRYGMLRAWANMVEVPVEWIVTGVWPQPEPEVVVPAAVKEAAAKKLAAR